MLFNRVFTDATFARAGGRTLAIAYRLPTAYLLGLDARTIAKMPARTASGRLSQCSKISAKSGAFSDKSAKQYAKTFSEWSEVFEGE